MDQLMDKLTAFLKLYLHPKPDGFKSNCRTRYSGPDCSSGSPRRGIKMRCNVECDLMVLGGLVRLANKLGLMPINEKETKDIRYENIYDEHSISDIVREVKECRLPSLHALHESYAKRFIQFSPSSSRTFSPSLSPSDARQPGCAVQQNLQLAIDRIVSCELGLSYDSAKAVFPLGLAENLSMLSSDSTENLPLSEVEGSGSRPVSMNEF
jgi:hypothetical protein